MSGSLATSVQKLVNEVIRFENERIEADLLSVPGVYAGMPHEDAQALGLEVVRQAPPGKDWGVPCYRGIRQRGEWVIDHCPQWGPVYG